MTLTINAEVRGIEPDSEGNTVVRLYAENRTGEETVAIVYNTTEGLKEYTQKQINSNTEGKVIGAEITLVVEGTEPPVKLGQVITFGAHFTRDWASDGE